MNVAEILKDCPKGTKLYSPLCGECTLDSINQSSIFLWNSNERRLFSCNKYGQYFPDEGECLLFPSKDNRDWSTFQRPFKDGDIVTYELRGGLVAFIYKERINTIIVKSHFALYAQNMGFLVDSEIALKEDELVFATEEMRDAFYENFKEHVDKCKELL